MKDLKFMWKLVVALVLVVATVALAATELGNKANPSAQAAAEALRERAGADAAFLAAGLLKEKSASGDLASMLQYPSDELVVVTLTGEQLKRAIERSVASYPQSSGSFLQLAQVSVVFSPALPPENRVIEIKVAGNLYVPTREYTVAMPSSLARGALGYFKIWDKERITKTLGMTVESVLSGKTGSIPTSAYTVK
jgi:2',3'-cyclic-nucleotide 2'-phosphodiesterase (5'-nucleotidase family)